MLKRYRHSAINVSIQMYVYNQEELLKTASYGRNKSSRRKKYKKSFVGEKRRSARLLALEVEGSSKSSHQIQWKTNIKDAYHTQEIGETSNGIFSDNGTIGKIIQHVLDVLELKDTHELFTMPDSMQIDDYTERVKSPSDFATLRQKNIDGMYTNLEQFESDVYTVFKKAITINDHNTIPYKQAIFLQDQAKQVLQSLNNNRTNSKLDACQQKHIRGRKRLRQNDETDSPSFNPALSSGKPNNRICSKRKKENIEVRVTENRNESNDVCSNSTKRYLRNAQLMSTKNFQTREESHAMEPRLAYIAGKDSQFGIISSTFGNKKPFLVLNTPTPTYLQSLWSFTKYGGKEAQKAAEERCQVCTKKAQVPILPQFGGSFCGPITFDSTRLAQFIPQQIATLYNTSCKLETDELLKWFQSFGTPEFFEKDVQLKTNYDQVINQKQIPDFPKKNSSPKEIHTPVKKMTRLKDSVKDMKKLFTTSSSCHGAVSSQLGFSQYATLLRPFQPDV